MLWCNTPQSCFTTNRGRLNDAELAELRDAGMSDAELIEVIAIIGWYVLSTYVNNLAQTDVDGFWTK